MALRKRRNVLSPGAGTELEWYARAVTRLLAQPLSLPTSWRYMAAVHGRMSGGPDRPDVYATPADVIPSDSGTYWDQCQHQTWFFLPWHRAYLASFEAVVAKAIVELGGPADWALPYWDYSDGAASRIMPQAFCQPADETNPLWNPWSRTPDGDFGFTNSTVSLDCLRHGQFAGSNNGGEPGFAGPVTGFMHFGGQVGLPSGRLESAPHNQIHGAISGLMGDPDYAALDPIFWLHHANIDRLWEVWRKAWPQNANPSDQAWLKGTVFQLHDGDGAPMSVQAEAMLDTTTVLHGYEYDNIELPAGITLPATPVLEAVVARRRDEAELAGANNERISLAGGTARTKVAVRSTRVALESLETASAPLRAFINLEQITGRGMPGNYDVYVAVPNQAPVFAGSISTFGIEQASRLDKDGHGGNGLTRVIDVTHLVEQLKLGRQDGVELDVTIQKVAPVGQRAAVLPLETSGESVRVGRVSVYFA